MEIISNYSFSPSDLNVDERKPGISAFMRVKNGEEFLDAVIRSHIDLFDEIVVLYNMCTDNTVHILNQLNSEFGSKLRIIKYEDRVFPPGSEGHEKTQGNSPNSMVNYSNVALASTKYTIATKIDDDQLANVENLKLVIDKIVKNNYQLDRMLCYSGLNLLRLNDNSLGIYAHSPISGNGDIGFFQVKNNTFFLYDRRFERFNSKVMRREFCGFLYWHLKFLKRGMGFENYEINENPNSRYKKRLYKLMQSPLTVSLSQIRKDLKPNILDILGGVISSKKKLNNVRDYSVCDEFPGESIDEIFKESVPNWKDIIGRKEISKTPTLKNRN